MPHALSDIVQLFSINTFTRLNTGNSLCLLTPPDACSFSKLSPFLPSVAGVSVSEKPNNKTHTLIAELYISHHTQCNAGEERPGLLYIRKNISLNLV